MSRTWIMVGVAALVGWYAGKSGWFQMASTSNGTSGN